MTEQEVKQAIEQGLHLCFIDDIFVPLAIFENEVIYGKSFIMCVQEWSNKIGSYTFEDGVTFANPKQVAAYKNAES